MIEQTLPTTFGFYADKPPPIPPNFAGSTVSFQAAWEASRVEFPELLTIESLSCQSKSTTDWLDKTERKID